MKKTGPAARAAASAKKDKAKRVIADDTASDSASSEDGRLVTKRERDKKLKRDLQEQDEETQRIQRLINEATLRNKEKLKELAAVRNAYPVIVRILFWFQLSCPLILILVTAFCKREGIVDEPVIFQTSDDLKARRQSVVGKGVQHEEVALWWILGENNIVSFQSHRF